MKHNVQCERAVQHHCECSQCGGSQHGWPGRLELARSPSNTDREQFRARADQAWAMSDPASPGEEPSGDRKAAAADTAVADIVDWLAENPTAIDYTQSIGNMLRDNVMPELEKRLEASSDRQVQKARQLDHFWCDLLVGVVYAIDKFKQFWRSVPDHVASEIIAMRAANGRAAVSDDTVTVAVQTAWKMLGESLQVERAKDILLAARVLATLLCKAPEEHKAVVQFCIAPLTKGIIAPSTKSRLQEIFPAEWLSELRRSLAS